MRKLKCCKLLSQSFTHIFNRSDLFLSRFINYVCKSLESDHLVCTCIVYRFFIMVKLGGDTTRINRENALRLWDSRYGNVRFAEDFHGYLMCREGYGNPDYYVYQGFEKTYCGWNIHHILPKSEGGTNAISNLLCTNIVTNEEAGDRVTYWIDGCLYQVQRTDDGYDIFQLN